MFKKYLRVFSVCPPSLFYESHMPWTALFAFILDRRVFRSKVVSRFVLLPAHIFWIQLAHFSCIFFISEIENYFHLEKIMNCSFNTNYKKYLVKKLNEINSFIYLTSVTLTIHNSGLVKWACNVIINQLQCNRHVVELFPFENLTSEHIKNGKAREILKNHKNPRRFFQKSCFF